MYTCVFLIFLSFHTKTVYIYNKNIVQIVTVLKQFYNIGRIVFTQISFNKKYERQGRDSSNPYFQGLQALHWNLFRRTVCRNA